jgi:hypothetical protein
VISRCLNLGRGGGLGEKASRMGKRGWSEREKHTLWVEMLVPAVGPLEPFVDVPRETAGESEVDPRVLHPQQVQLLTCGLCNRHTNFFFFKKSPSMAEKTKGADSRPSTIIPSYFFLANNASPGL